jgi:type VI protein secretion system component Hcp
VRPPARAPAPGATSVGARADFLLAMVLSPVIVSSFQSGGSAGSDVIPMDQIALNYAKIKSSTRNKSLTARWVAKSSAGET